VIPGGVKRRFRTSPADARTLSISFRVCSICEEGEELGRVTDLIVAAELAEQTSEWARFPAGPLERHYRREGPEGVERRGPLQTLKGRSKPFLDGPNSGKPLLITKSDARPSETLPPANGFISPGLLFTAKRQLLMLILLTGILIRFQTG